MPTTAAGACADAGSTLTATIVPHRSAVASSRAQVERQYSCYAQVEMALGVRPQMPELLHFLALGCAGQHWAAFLCRESN